MARLLEAIDGPCLGRLLAFPVGLPAVVAVVGANGRYAVHAVRAHPRAVGSYRPDAVRRGCARFHPAARSAA
ncbi:MAG: hypothetical protein H3C62_00740 [Gemmatimonadaceae bacterium]|nr:hypothetical protein [Gemmatimonadaceae bacterium]